MVGLAVLALFNFFEPFLELRQATVVPGEGRVRFLGSPDEASNCARSSLEKATLEIKPAFNAIQPLDHFLDLGVELRSHTVNVLEQVDLHG